MPCVSVCFPALVILPWAVLVSSLSVYKLHCDSQCMLDAANSNRFYGEKLKQAVYEPRPCDTCWKFEVKSFNSFVNMTKNITLKIFCGTSGSQALMHLSRGEAEQMLVHNMKEQSFFRSHESILWRECATPITLWFLYLPSGQYDLDNQQVINMKPF